MSLSNLLKKRFSVRAFLDKPVSEKILQKIFTDAQLSPSNCNVQPWRIHVVSGVKKDELKGKLVEELMSGKEPNPDFDWRVRYKGIHRDRQFESANALYPLLMEITFFASEKISQIVGDRWKRYLNNNDLASETEPGVILSIFRENNLGRIPNKIFNLLKQVKSVRNKLAHLQPVDYQEVNRIWSFFDQIS